MITNFNNENYCSKIKKEQSAMFLIPIVISTIFSLLSAFVTFLNTHASQVSEKDLEKLEYKQDIGFYFVSILINKKKK